MQKTKKEEKLILKGMKKFLDNPNHYEVPKLLGTKGIETYNLQFTKDINDKINQFEEYIK